jgi:mono/diheme cytochrome c family protein
VAGIVIGSVFRAALPISIAALMLASGLRASAQAPGPALTGADLTGAELYRAACAACHGLDGTGAPQSVIGFEDLAPPDFTDCAFGTVEPDGDWLAVAHSGGPARGFDRRMPAFGEVLTEAQILSVIDHLRTFCTDPAWPRGDLNLPRALFTEKAFPENEAVVTTSVAASGPGTIENTILYEQRVGARSQVEVSLPFSAEDTDDGWLGGFGDLAVGLKRALAHSLERGAILSVGAELLLPTGDDALGTHVTKVEPFVSFGQMLPSDLFLQAHTGVELSTDRQRAAHEAFWRLAFGGSYAQQRFGRTWSPMLEVLGARELERGHGVEWDVVPQIQVTLSTRQHIMVSVGVRIPVSERDARPTRVVMYFLWDWFDGGLAAGW